MLLNSLKRRIVKFHCPFFISFCLFLIFNQAVAGYEFTPKLKTAYEQLFQLRTSSARQLIKQELQKDPANGIAIYLNNYTDVVECIITGEDYRYNLLNTAFEGRIKTIESLNSNSPYHLFVLSEMKLQMAFTKLYFQDKVSAFWTLRSAYKLTNQNIQKYPGFKPSLKTAGILEILVGSIPPEHQWIVGFSGFSGTKEQGLKLLKNVIEKDPLFKDEAQLIYWLTEFHLLRNNPIDQLKKVNAFYNQDRDNLLVAFIYSSMLTSQGRNNESLEVLNRLPDGNDYVSFQYLNTMRGNCYLYNGEYQLAIINYNQFLKHNKGSNYVKFTNFNLSLAYWLLDDYKNSDKYRIATINAGVAAFDSDKKAYKYANQNIELNKTLLKAQLYYDGGYYDETLSLLNNTDEGDYPNLDHKVEYFYRKGRTYQKIRFYDKAIRHYVSAINVQKPTQQLYFAPNACLQLGYIFKELKQKDKALTYFKKAMTYQGHEYKSSIDNEAKNGIKELSRK